MVDIFQNISYSLLSETFPQKDIIISPEDKPWFTERLRRIKRQRQREYTRHGRSVKYNELASKFDEIFKSELSKYLMKIKLEVAEGKRGSSYPTLKRLGLQPGETTHGGFHLPQHVEQNFSSTQSAEVIAEHFTRISQEYSPLNISRLPPNV